MEAKTINKLKQYLTDEQLQAYVTESECFTAYFRDMTPDNLKKYKVASEAFIVATGGKQACEVIPLSVW